jgi:hypothetical protein
MAVIAEHLTVDDVLITRDTAPALALAWQFTDPYRDPVRVDVRLGVPSKDYVGVLVGKRDP